MIFTVSNKGNQTTRPPVYQKNIFKKLAQVSKLDVISFENMLMRYIRYFYGYKTDDFF
jgi:hypothetical protein